MEIVDRASLTARATQWLNERKQGIDSEFWPEHHRLIHDLLADRERLEQVIQLYNAAAGKFIAKVESGRASSHVTYAELRTARDAAQKAAK